MTFASVLSARMVIALEPLEDHQWFVQDPAERQGRLVPNAERVNSSEFSFDFYQPLLDRVG